MQLRYLGGLPAYALVITKILDAMPHRRNRALKWPSEFGLSI